MWTKIFFVEGNKEIKTCENNPHTFKEIVLTYRSSVFSASQEVKNSNFWTHLTGTLKPNWTESNIIFAL